MKVDRTAVAVLAPADRTTLSTLGFDADVFGGDRSVVAEALRSWADRIDARVAVATYGDGRVHGYAAVCPPASDNPLADLPPVIELVAYEVAPRYRRRGLFTHMFEALLRNDLEYRIVFVIADPAKRPRTESVRAFRDRLSATFGSLGFVPLPTDDTVLHPGADASLFVRIGRGVTTPDIEDFFGRLRSSSCPTVALSLKPSMLRALLRDELEGCGFRVRSISAGGDTELADVLVTDNGGGPARLLTVRLSEGAEIHRVGESLWYPMTQLDRLGEVLRKELQGVHEDA